MSRGAEMKNEKCEVRGERRERGESFLPARRGRNRPAASREIRHFVFTFYLSLDTPS